MKYMVSALLILSLGLSGCSSQKKLTEEAPFVIKDAICQTWVGGREESGKGMEVKFYLEGLSGAEVVLDQLFFRGRVSDIALSTTEEGTTATCTFTEHSKDISMHSDPTREVGNQPPRMKTEAEMNFPFELEQDEAVISYMEGDRMRYFKITGMVEKPGKVYLGREQQ
jgi:hypothetical protein